jgi:hypothetical protein
MYYTVRTCKTGSSLTGRRYYPNMEDVDIIARLHACGYLFVSVWTNKRRKYALRSIILFLVFFIVLKVRLDLANWVRKLFSDWKIA